MNIRRLFILWAGILFPVAAWAQSAPLADSLFLKGKDFDRSGNMEQAEFYYREAYELYRNFRDTTSWMEAGKEYASALVYRSKYHQAMKLYKMLLEVSHPANDIYNRGDIYNSMGWASNLAGKMDQGLMFYHHSLPLAEQSGDSLLIGIVYDNLGGAYFRKGNYTKSLDFRQKALSYFQGIDASGRVAITLSNIGIVYKQLSLYDRALEYYTHSFEIQKELGNIFSLSLLYDKIGDLQRELGNYNQSIIAYQKSLKYSRKAGVPRRTGTVLNNIGLLYKTLGEYQKASNYYRQSLAIKKEASGPRSVATITKNLGKVLWEQGKIKEATDNYKRALILRRQVGNPYDIASSLNTMVEVELHNQNYEQAREYVRQIKAIGDSTNNYSILEYAAAYLGEINRAEGKDQAALQYYQKAYAFSNYLPASKQLTPLLQLARQFHKLNSDSSIVYGQKAVDIIEQTRLKAGGTSDLKTGFFKKYSDFYIQLASWVLKYEPDTARAFRLVEQAKARSFSDKLAKASIDIDQQLPEEVQVRRKEQQNSIDSLYTRLESSSNAEEQARISSDIQTAELNHAAYQNKLAKEYPELKKVKRLEPIELEHAQSLVDEETAVLEYAIAGNELIMFLIGQDEVRVEQFSLSDVQPLDEVLTSRIASFREIILSNASRNRLKTSSGELYRILVKPFSESLDDYTNLIIVPDGALAYLPFEALLQDGRYLIEDFRIKYEPSLTSLTLLDEPEPGGRKELLAIAGSHISENFGMRSASTNQLSALPSTIIEVDSIASHFQQVSLLKDKQVSEQALKDLLQQNRYQYVHLATHGLIDENRPGRSGLTLSAEEKITASSKEDGILRSSEILALNIHSDMVVLSACNTGLGKVVEGEGMLGMQRSFFYAGTATVVVSLWSVYDRSTAFLMNEFYKALISNEREEGWIDAILRWAGWDESIPFGKKATAMRQAKLDMINHPLYHHPVYWAPFIVVGK